MDEEQTVEAHGVAGLSRTSRTAASAGSSPKSGPRRQRPLRTARARPAGEQHLLGRARPRRRRRPAAGASPAVDEERLQERGALLLQHPGDDLGPVVQAAVAQHVPQRARGAGAGLPAPKTTGATRASPIAPAHMVHGSRVTASVQPSSRHSPARRPRRAGPGSRRARWGRERLARVASGGELAALGVDDDGADRHVTGAGRGGGDRQGRRSRRVGRQTGGTPEGG